MKSATTPIFLALFFSCFMPILTHPAAESPSTTSLLFRRGAPLTQAQLNEIFHDGARDNEPEKLSKALKLGAHVDYRGFKEQTALHYVLGSTNYKKHDEKKANIQQLIQYKVDINAQDYDGRTPLILSLMKQKNDITQLLLSAKADPKICTINGESPFTIFENDDPDRERFELLLEWDAPPKSELALIRYNQLVEKYQKNPPVEVQECKKRITKDLQQFIPVIVLGDLVMEYVSNLDIQITVNRSK